MQYDSCIALYDATREIDWLSVKERLKPGAHIVSITSPLQHHKETARIEDAGIEVRDCVLFLSTPTLLVTLARIPVEGTVAQNVLKHGVGGINIDGTRVSAEPRRMTKFNVKGHSGCFTTPGGVTSQSGRDYEARVGMEGRWPANCILGGDFDDKFPKTNKQAICKSDDKSGWQTDYVGGKVSRAVSRKLYLDEDNGGSAARFFYNVSDENKLRGLIAYLHKLITPAGGNTLWLTPPDYITQ